MIVAIGRALSIVVVGVLLLNADALAQDRDLAGRYRITGTNPGGQGEYRGEVAVVRTGEVYQVAWTIGGLRHVGTGILLDNQLSVVYQPEEQGPGIAVYELQSEGSLEGFWTNLGGSTLGTERWVPQGRT